MNHCFYILTRSNRNSCQVFLPFLVIFLKRQLCHKENKILSLNYYKVISYKFKVWLLVRFPFFTSTQQLKLCTQPYFNFTTNYRTCLNTQIRKLTLTVYSKLKIMRKTKQEFVDYYFTNY
jgi:hypothetical protein